MNYYDHASMQAHKLGKWSDGKDKNGKDLKRGESLGQKPVVYAGLFGFLCLIIGFL